ncbi:hypothetical protein NMG60_11029339 [Bertholletia excelsa]
MSSSTRTGDVKGFFRQRKGSGISKAKAKKSPPKHSVTFGAEVVQPPALVSHHGSLDLTDNWDEKEEVLRQFDMNMAYGPCLGMTRLARWERAQSLGLNPPEEVGHLLRESNVRPECLWDGIV